MPQTPVSGQNFITSLKKGKKKNENPKKNSREKCLDAEYKLTRKKIPNLGHSL
jgi:hypothetical protein